MALVHGDTVIPAGSFNGDGRAADLSVGSLCPDGLLIGAYTGDAGADDWVWWNNGTSYNPEGSGENLRKCVAYTGADFLGKTVKLNNASPAFRGVVVQQLNVELNDTDGDGTPVPVVVIKTDNFTYAAEPSNISEVD